jgi:hypothetical protein
LDARQNNPDAKGLRLAAAPGAHYLPNDTCQEDPDLARVIQAWPDLPAAVRAGIVAMIAALPLGDRQSESTAKR